MASGLLRAAVGAVAALAAGFAGGWVAGRASVPPPPKPVPFVNPLAEVRTGESLVLRQGSQVKEQYLVAAVEPDSLLLVVTRHAEGVPPVRREIRVARTFLGAFSILEGDVAPDGATAAQKDFVLESLAREDLFVPTLSRTFSCWKVTGHDRTQGPRTYWITDEIPVHGLLRADGARGTVWEVDGFGWGQ